MFLNNPRSNGAVSIDGVSNEHLVVGDAVQDNEAGDVKSRGYVNECLNFSPRQNE